MRARMAVLSIAVGLFLGGLAAPVNAAPVNAAPVTVAPVSVAPVSAAPAPSPQCVKGCNETAIRVGPDGGYAGAYNRTTTVTLSWTVSNVGSTYAEVAVRAGATGCARTVAPYVSPNFLYLAPGQTASVRTYVSGQCAGAGRAYASAGQDQGWRDIYFY